MKHKILKMVVQPELERNIRDDRLELFQNQNQEVENNIYIAEQCKTLIYQKRRGMDIDVDGE